MQPNFENHNQMWATILIEELCRLGVRQFVISPGSRSTPLVLAVADNSKAKTVVHFDERGAAFFALGYARATGEPVALICTSGTATANYYPAVMEASNDFIPLILLTADRPPELHDCGANQTVGQIDLYEKHARFSHSFDCPEDMTDIATNLTIVDEAAAAATGYERGPVHLNCMFREPFFADGNSRPVQLPDRFGAWYAGNTTYSSPQSSIFPSGGITFEQFLQIVKDAKQPLLIAGRLRTGEESEAVEKLAEVTGWTEFADVLSGCKFGDNLENHIRYYDLLIESHPDLLNSFDVVIQFGRPPVSKRLLQHLATLKPEKYIKVQPFARNDDPAAVVTDYYFGDIADITGQLTARYDSYWRVEMCATLKEADNLIARQLDSYIDTNAVVNELATVRSLLRSLTAEDCLFVASSRPIRDIDTYLPTETTNVPIGCNRGVSGIDGTIASAVGFAKGHGKRLSLLMGDLAFLHDLNSLALLRELDKPATMVLINNNGGGIFSFLPVATKSENFERYFGTPHELTFESVANMFNLDYHRPESNEEVRHLLEPKNSGSRHVLIEVRTDRRVNRQLHQEIIDRLKQAVSG